MRKKSFMYGMTIASILMLTLVLGGCFGDNPELGVSPTHLNFGRTQEESSFMIDNTGDGTLEWEIEWDADWIDIEKTSGEDAAEVEVQVDRSGLDPDEYSAEIEVKSNVRDKKVGVIMEVPDPDEPQLLIQPNSLDFGKSRITQTFNIENLGAGTLEWEVEVDEPWVSVSESSGENDGVIEVTVDREDMDPGEYQTDLDVLSNDRDSFVRLDMEVTEPEEIDPPEAPEYFDVRGLTVPVNTFEDTAVKTYMSEARRMDEEVSLQGSYVINDEPMPAGYEGGYILAWDEVTDADGYLVLQYDEESGEYIQHIDLNIEAGDLEDPSSPTYGI